MAGPDNFERVLVDILLCFCYYTCLMRFLGPKNLIIGSRKVVNLATVRKEENIAEFILVQIIY
jgi:hypothetical protein